MVWQGVRRRQLPPGWAGLRKARLELDGYRCTALNEFWTPDGPTFGRCTHCATDVHHAGGPHDHRIEALRSLCAAHHAKETQDEARAARANKPQRRRAERPHPGLR